MYIVSVVFIMAALPFQRAALPIMEKNIDVTKKLVAEKGLTFQLPFIPAAY